MNKRDVFKIYRTIKSDSNFVIFDSDGVLLNCYGDYLKQRGYSIRVLNLCNPLVGHGYNPLSYISNDLESFQLCAFIVNLLSQKHDETQNEIRLQSILLSSLCLYLLKYRPKHEQNFMSVMKLLKAAENRGQNSSTKSTLDRLFDEVNEIGNSSIPLKEYLWVYSTGYKKYMVALSLYAKLSIFLTKPMSNITYLDTLNIYDLCSSMKIALFVTYPSCDSEVRFLGDILDFQLNILLSKERCHRHISLIRHDSSSVTILNNIASTSHRYDIDHSTYEQVMNELEPVGEMLHPQKLSKNNNKEDRREYDYSSVLDGTDDETWNFD